MSSIPSIDKSRQLKIALIEDSFILRSLWEQEYASIEIEAYECPATFVQRIKKDTLNDRYDAIVLDYFFDTLNETTSSHDFVKDLKNYFNGPLLLSSEFTSGLTEDFLNLFVAQIAKEPPCETKLRDIILRKV